LTGWAGLLMPVTVRVGAYIFENIHSTGSISAYYYTGMRDVFVSTLVLVGALLACYRTQVWHDNFVAIVAGLAAIGIGLFPMDPTYATEIILRHPGIIGDQCYLNRGILGYHFIFVTIFFSLSFYLVYFRFSAFTPENPTKQKLARNKIYKVCGMTLLISFLVIGYIAATNKGGSIFWPESIAVAAFAIAWLVKGRLVLKDVDISVKN
jgi:hypothetical protein